MPMAALTRAQLHTPGQQCHLQAPLPPRMVTGTQYLIKASHVGSASGALKFHSTQSHLNSGQVKEIRGAPICLQAAAVTESLGLKQLHDNSHHFLDFCDRQREEVFWKSFMDVMVRTPETIQGVPCNPI